MGKIVWAETDSTTSGLQLDTLRFYCCATIIVGVLGSPSEDRSFGPTAVAQQEHGYLHSSLSGPDYRANSPHHVPGRSRP
eukprot:4368271-Amphidinium_carterae.1